MKDAVEAAFAAVPENYYVLQPDGSPFPQSSNPKIIEAMLRLSGVSEGAHVLEIGTGSGFSTALLSHIVGSSGTVTSLEVDAAVADRARHLLSGQCVNNALVLAADGQKGCPSRAPFDVILSWATARKIPREWVRQLRVGGVIVTAVQLAPLAHAIAVVRLRCDSPNSLVGEQLIPGSFVPLSPAPRDDWGKAPDEADLVLDPDSDPATWISTEWLRESTSASDRERFIENLHALSVSENTTLPLASVGSFRAYLLSVCPDGLTTAYLNTAGRAIGYSDTQGAALLSLHNASLHQVGNGEARNELLRWTADWQARGSPGFEAVLPVTKPTVDGWQVRPQRDVSNFR